MKAVLVLRAMLHVRTTFTKSTYGLTAAGYKSEHDPIFQQGQEGTANQPTTRLSVKFP
jgi:hypothetical protein